MPPNYGQTGWEKFLLRKRNEEIEGTYQIIGGSWGACKGHLEHTNADTSEYMNDTHAHTHTHTHTKRIKKQQNQTSFSLEDRVMRSDVGSNCFLKQDDREENPQIKLRSR